MSLFDDDSYRWRETYFVLFSVENRPKLHDVEETLLSISDRFQVTNGGADDEGRFENVTLVSPLDFAALDVAYLSGDEVREEASQLATQIRPADEVERDKLKRLGAANARFDLMHFEQIETGGLVDASEEDERFDPSALLLVMEALLELTGGVGVDPQSGTIF